MSKLKILTDEYLQSTGTDITNEKKQDAQNNQKQPHDFKLRTDGNKSVLDVFITENVDIEARYEEIVTLMNRMKSTDEVHIYLHTNGGLVNSAIMLVNAMSDCDAPVIGHPLGKIISAGTMIATGCDRLDISEDSAFLFHQYFGGSIGKVVQVQQKANSMASSMKTVIGKMLDLNLIIEDEYKRIVEDGEDVYVSGRELMNRLSDCEQDENGYYILKNCGPEKEDDDE